MQKSLFIFLLFIASLVFSQRKQINCMGDTVKYLSIGKDNRGLGLGNPPNYSGFRLSIVDKNCITNGISLNMFSDVNSRKTNGLDIGFSQSAGSVNGISFGILGNNIDYELRGFGFGTLLSEGLNIYGVSITGGFQRVDKFKGLCISGLMYRSFETKGLVCSGVLLHNDSTFNGLAITTALSKVSILKGISMAVINWCEEVKGLQLGLINKTGYMKGIQVGAINIISENPKWARVFPIINISFKVNPINMDLGIENNIFVADPCKNGTLGCEVVTEITANDSLEREASSLKILSPDSMIISFAKPFNVNSIELYLDEKLVYPVKGQLIDSTQAFEQFVKIKKSDENFIKVVDKEQKKCMESSWKPSYAILRFSPHEEEGRLLMTYTNDFILSEKKE